MYISILAPARGATLYGLTIGAYPIAFQSSLPRGERPYTFKTCPTRSINFNPRSREGSDLKAGENPAECWDISILAPARGATYVLPFYKYIHINFNPRSREGSDGISWIYGRNRHIISILAPARGATAFFLLFPLGFWMSILAPARGATSSLVK